MPVLHPREQRDALRSGRWGRRARSRCSDVCAASCAAPCILPQSAHATRTSRMLRSICAARDSQGAGIDDAIHFDVLKRLQPRFAGVRAWSCRPSGALRRARATCSNVPERVARHCKNRMRQEMQREGALRQREVDRIDQKGHVVVHHLDDGVRRGEAMLAQGGIEHPHQRGSAARGARTSGATGPRRRDPSDRARRGLPHRRWRSTRAETAASRRCAWISAAGRRSRTTAATILRCCSEEAWYMSFPRINPAFRGRRSRRPGSGTPRRP